MKLKSTVFICLLITILFGNNSFALEVLWNHICGRYLVECMPALLDVNNIFQFKTDTFIKSWLLCGPFPNYEDCAFEDYKHGEHCKGFYTDYLESIGGEEQAAPKQRMTVHLAEGNLKRKWFLYQSETNHVPLDTLFTPNDMIVAYAFCQINSKKQQKVILSVGSNDGIQVFFNGKKVHENHPPNGQWLQKDSDFVPIVLKKGVNNLLLKICEGTGDCGFIVRFLDYDSTLADIRANLEEHKRLTLVTHGDTLIAQFGKPFKIATLNPGGKATIEIIHEKAGKLAEQKVNPGTETAFSLLNVPYGFFKAKATFRTPHDGIIVSEVKYFKGKLRRHLPPKLLKGLMPISETGQPFFPIGTYGAPPEDYHILKEAGYNFVVAGVDNLDKVYKAGLKAAVPVHGTKPNWFSEVYNTISKFKMHPAVLCWMLYDEPGYNRADLLDIYKLYNTAYEADSFHPSYLVITSPQAYQTFGRCCDVLAIDTYPIANGIIASVGENIAKAHREIEADQPIWHCGQLFSWPAQRRPTPQEHRFMTYSALIEGAKGVLWYTYKGYGQYLPVDDPKLWDFHKKLLEELNELALLFIEPGYGKNVTTVDSNPSIRTMFKKCFLGSFIIAANTSRTDTLSPEFKLEPTVAGEISVYGESRTLEIENGCFKDQFKPLDIHIYKLP